MARFSLPFIITFVVLHPIVASAIDHVVTNNSEFSAALSIAASGDSVLLAPGTYAGGNFASGLTGVTIRSQSATSLAVISGGNEGLHLTDVTNVTVQDLIIENSLFNGINIDDGGSFASPSTNVTLRNLIVRDIGGGGNNDGIKLSGVTGFTIERVTVTNWGEGGSAIDMVGAHNGLIENSSFRHDSLSGGGTGIRPKGGSKNIVIRANRVDLPGGNGRPIQAGGSTGAAFFRFIDGDSGYEADNITVEGNVILGGITGASYVNIDGGNFHHNVISQPTSWAIRILNENTGLVETQNGVFNDNVVLFDDGLSSSFVNIGPNTQPGTFMFARNQWFNVDDPGSSTPNLPSVETGGIIGIDPGIDLSGVVDWDFDWGLWLVNANDASNNFIVTEPAGFLLAVPGVGAEFDPLLGNPLIGAWTLSALTGTSIDLAAFSQAILIAVPVPPAIWFGITGVLMLSRVARRPTGRLGSEY